MLRTLTRWTAILVLLSILLYMAFAYGESQGRQDALTKSADAWICFVYADEANRRVGKLPSHIAAELQRAESEYGKFDEIEIYRVEPGPAKTIIRLHVMRGNNLYREKILLIGGSLRDFTSIRPE